MRAAVEGFKLAVYGANHEADLVGPGAICFFFCPNSLCFIPQIQPMMLGLCPIMPTNSRSRAGKMLKNAIKLMHVPRKRPKLP